MLGAPCLHVTAPQADWGSLEHLGEDVRDTLHSDATFPALSVKIASWAVSILHHFPLRRPQKLLFYLVPFQAGGPLGRMELTRTGLRRCPDH